MYETKRERVCVWLNFMLQLELSLKWKRIRERDECEWYACECVFYINGFWFLSLFRIIRIDAIKRINK